MTNARRILGNAIFLVVTLGAMISGGGVSVFVDVPSILLIIGALCLWITVPFFDAEAAETNDEFIKILRSMGLLNGPFLSLTIFIAAVLGFLIGAVQMLANITKPEFIGPSLAVCMLTLLYGLILCCVFSYPLSDWYRSRSGETQTFTLDVNIWILFPLFSNVAVLVLMFGLMFAVKGN